MVVIARYLNITLVVPELDKTSFWNDPRYGLEPKKYFCWKFILLVLLGLCLFCANWLQHFISPAVSSKIYLMLNTSLPHYEMKFAS
jgi:hypothetical protein